MRSEREIPAYGGRRTITRFLFAPVTIYVHHENGSKTIGKRWLERATYEEEWTRGRIGDFWKKIRWIN